MSQTAPLSVVDLYQNPLTKDWWRIVREWGTGCQWLETISDAHLEQGLPWTYETDLGDQTDAKEVMESCLMYKANKARLGLS